jgi:hypothetical protein
MANVGREIGLGATAKTMHVAEMQQPQGRAGAQDYGTLRAAGDDPQPDGKQARANAENRAHIRPEIVNDMSRQTVTATHTAPPARRDSEPSYDDQRNRDHSDRSSKRQEAEASHGRVSTDTGRDRPDISEKRAAALAQLKEHRASIAEKGEAQRPEQTATKAAFRSFGR